MLNFLGLISIWPLAPRNKKELSITNNLIGSIDAMLHIKVLIFILI